MCSRVAVALLFSLCVGSSFAQTKKGSKPVHPTSAKPLKGKTAKTSKPKPAAKLGELTYPEGRWEGVHVYNTPFEGIDADYAASAAVVLRVTEIKGIEPGAKITHYRIGEDADYVAVSDWSALIEASKEIDGNEIWVKGVDKAKHPFSTSLSILSDEVWTAPDEKPDLENLIPGVTLKFVDGGVDVTFVRPDAPLSIGSTVTGVYLAGESDPLPVEDLRALATQVVKAGADKVDLAVRLSDALVSRITVPVDVAVAKRWLGLEAPESAPTETCLSGIDGIPGASAKVAKVKAGGLRPGDVITGARRAGGTSFAKIGTWQDLADFLEAAGKLKSLDLRVVRATGETETVTGVSVR